MEATERLATVGVMGSSDRHLHRLQTADSEAAEQILERAEAVGRLLGHQAVNLLTGGGGGVMQAAGRGFVSAQERRGKLIGIIPGPHPREGYPNEFVEILIRTHLPGQDPLAETSRNHINILSSDIVIALPGGPGTHAEVQLAQRYLRPVCVCLGKHDCIGEMNGESWQANNVPWFAELDQLSDWLASRLSCQAEVQEG